MMFRYEHEGKALLESEIFLGDPQTSTFRIMGQDYRTTDCIIKDDKTVYELVKVNPEVEQVRSRYLGTLEGQYLTHMRYESDEMFMIHLATILRLTQSTMQDFAKLLEEKES